MNESGWRPGRILNWLARLLVPADVRDEFVGDLIEEAGRRRLTGRLWIAAQLLLSTPALLQLRLRRSGDGGSPVSVLAVLLGGIWFAADALFPPRIVWVAFFLLAAWMNAAAAVLIHRRTPFALLAAATGVGGMESLVGAALFLLIPPERMLSHPAFWIVAAASFIGYGLAWFWSRRSQPEAWRKWRASAEKTGMLGLLVFQHIPHVPKSIPS